MKTLVERDVIQLRSFYFGDNEDADKTIRSIRPVLENYVRKMAPDDCPEGNKWLGTFLYDICKASKDSSLAIFKPMYDDLDHLNSYTAPYAHDSALALPINRAELTAEVERTLKLIGRL